VPPGLMDFGIGPFAGESLGGSTFQNWFNLAAEKSPSILDQTHRFILNSVYEIPLYKNRSGAVAKMLGGWQLGGIWSAFSGGPLGVNSTVNNTFSQGGGQRPNWNGLNACVSDPTPDRWLASSAFSNPATYVFGSAPRTFNGCRSHGTAQIDMTLTKNTKLKDRLNLQFPYRGVQRREQPALRTAQCRFRESAIRYGERAEQPAANYSVRAETDVLKRQRRARNSKPFPCNNEVFLLVQQVSR
jgi:hypothetical protein